METWSKTYSRTYRTLRWPCCHWVLVNMFTFEPKAHFLNCRANYFLATLLQVREGVAVPPGRGGGSKYASPGIGQAGDDTQLQWDMRW